MEEHDGVAMRMESEWSDVMIRGDFAAATWDFPVDMVREMLHGRVPIPPDMLAETASHFAAMGRGLVDTTAGAGYAHGRPSL